MLKQFMARVVFVFSHKGELDTLLTEKRKKLEATKFEQERHHLNLCLKHQQEQGRSHFAEHNCDHCKLLAKLANS